MPVGIQLKRTKGWRKPENCIVVSRPSKWGNPYAGVLHNHGPELAIELYRMTASGVWSPELAAKAPGLTVYELHCLWLKRIGGHPIEVARTELRGYDLACWCPIGAPCHRDVLLEIANG